MQKSDKRLFLILPPILLFLGGAIGLVFNNQDHPSPLPFYAMNIGGLLAFISFGYVLYQTRIGESWPNRALDISQRYHGEAKIINRQCNTNSYIVSFIYKSVNMEFLDTYITIYPKGRWRAVAAQDKLLIRCSVSKNFNVYTQMSTGSGLIGQTLDFLKADGHKDLSLNPQLSMYKGVVICSNNENEAIRFLIEPDVKNIYLKYLDMCTDYSGFPLNIEKGYINFNFIGVEGLRLKKDADLNLYLDDLITLTQKLQ